jgi:hypothetical protein
MLGLFRSSRGSGQRWIVSFRGAVGRRPDVGSRHGKKLSSFGPEEFMNAKKLILSWNIA